MAKVDQEAHFGISQSFRKALPAGDGQSQERQFLPDHQASPRDLVRWEVGSNTSIHEPQKQAGEEKQVFDSVWQKEITALYTGADREKPDEGAKTAITSIPGVLPDPTPHGKDIATFTRVTEPVTQTATPLTPLWQEGQLQKDVGNSLIRRPLNALQVHRGNREVALYTSNLPEPRQDQPSEKQVSLNDQPNVAVLRPDVLSLAKKTNDRSELSRAEEIVLNAIRSRADIDGKNAKVAYEALAAITGFSKRHVIRVVKSLTHERGLVRVDKKVVRPGKNAINVYHVVNRDVTATDTGSGMKKRKTGQTETTRVTEHVTPTAKITRNPSLRSSRLIPHPQLEAKSNVVTQVQGVVAV